MPVIDLNCDLGEGGLFDSDIMPLISSCNIACGGHAGNEATIAKTVELALAHQVNIGAHPSYPDKENFGRKHFPMDRERLKKSLQKQIEKVRKEVQKQSGLLHHIKPHGALYNELVKDKEKATLITDAIVEIDPSLILFVPPHSIIKTIAGQKLKIWVEGFADRSYEADFSLTPRSQPDAVLTNKKDVFKQVLNMVNKNKISLKNGTTIAQKFDTVCLHSDTENCVELLEYLNKQLPKT